MFLVSDYKMTTDLSGHLSWDKASQVSVLLYSNVNKLKIDQETDVNL